MPWVPWAAKPKNRLSPEYLLGLCNDIIKCSQNVEGLRNADQVVDTLKQLAELLVWGDRNEPKMFDVFLERNMLPYLTELLCAKVPVAVRIQLIQTLYILIQNVACPTSIFYLLSGNHINKLIMFEGFDFDGDDELLSHFINFLKSLSLRLDEGTIQCFYNRETDSFPLYVATEKFLTKDLGNPLVTAAARAVVVHMCQVKDEYVLNYVVRSANYVKTVFQSLCSLQTKLDALLTPFEESVNHFLHPEALPRPFAPPVSLAVLSSAIEDILEDYSHLDDLLSVREKDALRFSVFEETISYCRRISPVLQGLDPPAPRTPRSSPAMQITVPKCVCFVLTAQWLYLLREDKEFIEMVARALSGSDETVVLERPPSPVKPVVKIPQFLAAAAEAAAAESAAGGSNLSRTHSACNDVDSTGSEADLPTEAAAIVAHPPSSDPPPTAEEAPDAPTLPAGEAADSATEGDAATPLGVDSRVEDIPTSPQHHDPHLGACASPPPGERDAAVFGESFHNPVPRLARWFPDGWISSNLDSGADEDPRTPQAVLSFLLAACESSRINRSDAMLDSMGFLPRSKRDAVKTAASPGIMQPFPTGDPTDASPPPPLGAEQEGGDAEEEAAALDSEAGGGGALPVLSEEAASGGGSSRMVKAPAGQAGQPSAGGAVFNELELPPVLAKGVSDSPAPIPSRPEREGGLPYDKAWADEAIGGTDYPFYTVEMVLLHLCEIVRTLPSRGRLETVELACRALLALADRGGGAGGDGEPFLMEAYHITLLKDAYQMSCCNIRRRFDTLKKALLSEGAIVPLSGGGGGTTSEPAGAVPPPAATPSGSPTPPPPPAEEGVTPDTPAADASADPSAANLTTTPPAEEGQAPPSPGSVPPPALSGPPPPLSPPAGDGGSGRGNPPQAVPAAGRGRSSSAVFYAVSGRHPVLKNTSLASSVSSAEGRWVSDPVEVLYLVVSGQLPLAAKLRAMRPKELFAETVLLPTAPAPETGAAGVNRGAGGSAAGGISGGFLSASQRPGGGVGSGNPSFASSPSSAAAGQYGRRWGGAGGGDGSTRQFGDGETATQMSPEASMSFASASPSPPGSPGAYGRGGASPGLYVIVGSSGAKVRKGEQMDTKMLKRLPQGTEVAVVEVRARRARLAHPMEGWVSLWGGDGVPILEARDTQQQQGMLGAGTGYVCADSVSGGAFSAVPSRTPEWLRKLPLQQRLPLPSHADDELSRVEATAFLLIRATVFRLLRREDLIDTHLRQPLEGKFASRLGEAVQKEELREPVRCQVCLQPHPQLGNPPQATQDLVARTTGSVFYLCVADNELLLLRDGSTPSEVVAVAVLPLFCVSAYVDPQLSYRLYLRCRSFSCLLKLESPTVCQSVASKLSSISGKMRKTKIEALCHALQDGASL